MFSKIFRKKSFGLLEVVIVVAIFLMCLAAIISITGLSYKNLVANENRWKATILAQNKLEEIRKLRDDNLIAGKTWNQDLPTATITEYYGNDMGPGNFFTVTLEPCLISGIPVQGAYKTRVSWNQFGQTKSVEYRTFLKDIDQWVE